MFNRNFINIIVYFAILLMINSMGMIEFGSRTVATFTSSTYAGVETDEETNINEGSEVDFSETTEIDKDDTTDHDLEIHNQGGYVKKEPLNQEYINNLTKNQEEKVAYLTFDDGPTPKITTEILEILKQEEIIATFFVLGINAEEYPQIIKQIDEEGHVIANHTYSHNYGRIYKNPNAYMEDLLRGEAVIKSILGEDYGLTLTRFPGGSFGKSKEGFRRRVNEEGYVYVDWNSLNGDGEGIMQPEKYLIDRYRATAGNKKSLIILMHDAAGKNTTVTTLPFIIKDLKKAGYQFRALPQYIEIEMVRDYSVSVFRR